ncbi:E3 ubiquitin-protein ligase ATL42 [Raphanus sativus]|uniref:RING-type E3 ubiquitin transferase n=1 Tax=Raphanus sativus TaxID=3726 RepID=A0A6J0LK21_RAPSA|nr:E3 ubiquitin-protein ligase ATL42-like [Raphanus sativus]KAJ4899281.1 E3 ubiquitin-protein ligase ATL42 [Raphanus sativus]
MYQNIFFFFLTVFCSDYYVSAQPPAPPPFTNGDLAANFEPSLAVVTVVLAVMFSLTFVLLVYAKCCRIDLRRPRTNDGSRQDRRGIFINRSANPSDRFSGLEKTVIESLPLFRFSALKGSKQGLDCSVCLSKFESVEILRLLPNCRHAFHVGCIDQWLEQHATCPLCRDRVEIEEEYSVYGNSFRFLNQSEVQEGSSLELYIEREEEEEVGQGSSRFSIGDSFRKILKLGHKEKPLLDQQGNEKDENKLMHKFNHRIVVSDVVFKNRWSNVSSSDLMFLNSEMVNSMSSERFSSLDRVKRGDEEDQRGSLWIKEDTEAKRMVENKLSAMKTMLLLSENGESGSKSRSVMVEPGRRSVSEITAVPRFSIAVHGDYSGSTAASALETERRRRLWLPIARNTAQWFANREKINQINTTHQHFDV